MLMWVSCMFQVNELGDYSITACLVTDQVLASANPSTSAPESREQIYASHDFTMLPGPHARVREMRQQPKR
jgi:hypothetical protein